jgi:hypothetical protein
MFSKKRQALSVLCGEACTVVVLSRFWCKKAVYVAPDPPPFRRPFILIGVPWHKFFRAIKIFLPVNQRDSNYFAKKVKKPIAGKVKGCIFAARKRRKRGRTEGSGCGKDL